MVTEVANLVARLRADTSEYVAGMQKAISADDAFIASQKRKIAQYNEVGGALTKYVTVPILAAGAASVILTQKFDDSFAHIAAATKLPGPALAELKNQVLDISRATAQSPTGLAETLVGIERSGVGAKNAVGVLDVAAKESATHFASSAQAADTLTSVMNAYGSASLSAAAAGDILTKGAETSKITIDGLSQSLGRALPAAQTLGVSFGDLVAAEATMTKEGLSAGQAGMSLFRILSSIENPSSTGAKALHSLGLSASEAQQMIKQGDFEGLLLKIAQAAKGNDQAILQLTGGIRGASGAFAAFSNDGKSLRDEFTAIHNSTGSLDEAMSQMAKTPGFQLKQAITSIEDAMIKWGDAFAPVIHGLSTVVADTGDFVGWLGKMNPVLKDGVVLFLAAAAAAGPLLLAVGGLAKAWLAITTVLKGKSEADAASVASNQAAGTAAVERAAKEQVLTDALIEQNAVQQTNIETTAARGGEQLGLFAGEGAGIAASQQQQLPMVLPPVGAGAATGEELLGPIAATAPEAAGGIGAAAAALGPFAIAAGAAIGITALLSKEFHDSGNAARAHAADVKGLTQQLTDYNSAGAAQQNKLQQDALSRVRAALDAARALSYVQIGPAAQPGMRDPNNLTAGVKVTSGDDPAHAQKQLDDFHKSLLAVADAQGALAVKPAFTRFMAEGARIPGFAGSIAHQFDDIAAKIAAAEKPAHDLASTLGVPMGQAATAIAQADAELNKAGNATEDMRAAAEKAAVALSVLGVNGAYAGDAVKAGMSAADTAVLGLAQSINDTLSLASTADSVLSAVTTAQQPPSGGGGGGQTATAQALDHAQKELTLRDALLQVRQTALGVQQAELSLAQAHESVRESAITLSRAEKDYETILHGVAAGSREAAVAQDTYAQAKNDAALAGLDTAQARRNLEQIKNDKKLLDFAVADARQKLHDDITGAGGEEHWVVTPTGSKMEMVGGTPKASGEQLAKDRIALKDAQIAQAGGADTVRRAQIELSNAEINGRNKTRDLTDAHKLLNETLHGFAKNSKEAEDAYTSMVNAYLGGLGAIQGVQSAQLNLETAQNQVATSALGVQRAEADLAGLLSGSFSSAMQTAASNTHTAEQRMADYVTQEAALLVKTGKASDLTHGYRMAVHNLGEMLQGQLTAGGPLANFLQYLALVYGLVGKPPPPAAHVPATHRVPVGNTGVFAAGGPIVGNDPNGIHILAHPGEFVVQRKAVEKYGTHMMERINAGAANLPAFAEGGSVAGAVVIPFAEASSITAGTDAVSALVDAVRASHPVAPTTQGGGSVGGGTGGDVANLPPGVIVQWSHDFAVGMGDQSPTASLIAEIQTWAHRESGGGGGAFNPLNSTLAWPGATNFNSVGVKNYPSYDAGLRASIATFSEPQWAGVAAAIRANSTSGLAAAVNAEYATWGGGPILRNGGPVDGIPITAHSGEYVLSQAAVQKYGQGAMAALNAGAVQVGSAGGGGGGTTIVQQRIELTIQALDPATTADLVIPALREHTRLNTLITGVRTE